MCLTNIVKCLLQTCCWQVHCAWINWDRKKVVVVIYFIKIAFRNDFTRNMRKWTHCMNQKPAWNYFDRPWIPPLQVPVSLLLVDNYYNSMQLLQQLHSPSYHLSFLILLSIHLHQQVQCYHLIHLKSKLFENTDTLNKEFEVANLFSGGNNNNIKHTKL